jgi:cytolysin-activating lysine-acyltransferase
MTDKNTEAAALAALEQAKDALAKLPILGPALWLYARDPVKKFMFLGDTDWAVLPPIVLDQCRLYTKAGLPYAFITWAFVNDAVDARLRSSEAKIAPHEWKCGEHLWIIDAVAPFGQLEETLTELRETMFPGSKVCALLPDPAQAGATTLREWPPAPMPTTH